MAINDDNWYDEMWNPITGSTFSWPTSYGKEYCNRFKGDVRANMNSKNILRVSDDLFILDKPFPSDVPNHYIDCPVGDKPTFHRNRLSLISEKYKTGRNLLVCGMAELFDEAIPLAWIEVVLKTCKYNPQHNYIFLTTNYEKLEYVANTYTDLVSENMWFGISITEELFYQQEKISDFISRWKSKANIFLYFGEALNCHAEFLKDLGTRAVSKLSWIVAHFSYDIKFDIYNYLVSITKTRKFPLYISVGYGGKLFENFPHETPKEFSRHIISDGRKKLRVAKCGHCKREFEKQSMHTLGSYMKRGEGYKVVGWLCDMCYEKFKNQFEE